MMDFEQQIKNLNTEQASVVNHLDGPLLVIAGPGTGKTQILTLRVANILKKRDVKPHEILCLTFTNNAAANMQERLRSFIGLQANDVTMTTFHSLSSSIIAEFPQKFENFVTLSDDDKIIERDILAKLLKNEEHLKNFKATPFEDIIDKCLNHFGLIKKLGLSNDKILEVLSQNVSYFREIDGYTNSVFSKTLPRDSDAKVDVVLSYLEGLPNTNPTLKKALFGIWKKAILDDDINQVKQKLLSGGTTKAYHKQLEAHAKWIEITKLYGHYVELVAAQGIYDFDDMINAVINQLENDEITRLSIQEKYQYVMVDEFQDTNAAQYRLMQLITNHPGFEGKPNLMVVGDDDQAIYRFQGANASNMLDFRNDYQPVEIKLVNNYRSPQSILDFSRETADSLEDSFEKISQIDKSLTSHTSFKSEPMLLNFEDSYDQYNIVTKMISQIQEDQKEASIAILANKHRYLEDVARHLSQHKIKHYYERTFDALKNEYVIYLIKLIAAVSAMIELDKKSFEAKLHELLFDKLGPIDKHTLWKSAINRPKGKTLSESLDELALPEFNNLIKFIEECAFESTNLSVDDLLSKILGLSESTFRSPLYPIFNTEYNQEQLYCLEALKTIRANIRIFASANPDSSLNNINQYLSALVEKSKGLRYRVPSENNNLVQLMTVYGSKGLEFDYVFVLKSEASVWKPRNNKGVASPPNLDLHSFGDNDDDFIRLMFVAITRAKKQLYLCRSMRDDKAKAIDPYPEQAYHISQKNFEPLSGEARINALKADYYQIDNPEIESIIAQKVQTMKMNVTGLIKYIDLEYGGPAAFLQHNILQVAEAESDSSIFGSAIHEALRYAQAEHNPEHDINDSIKNTLKHFEKHLTKKNLHPSKSKMMYHKGNELIRRLFEELDFKFESAQNQTILTELAIDVMVGEVPFKGSLDLVIVDEKAKSIKIYDYKTGKPADLGTKKSAKDGFYAKFKSTKSIKHHIQLAAYILMLGSHPYYKNYKIEGSAMIYLETPDRNQLYQYLDESNLEIKQVKGIIETVYDEIKALKFGEPDLNNQFFIGS